MTVADLDVGLGPRRRAMRSFRSQMLWLAVLLVWGLCLALPPAPEASFASALIAWPDGAILPLVGWLDFLVKGLANFELVDGFRVADATRALVPAVDAGTGLVADLLSVGITRGFGDNAVQVVPPLSWLGVSIAMTALGLRLGGLRLAALTAGTLAFLLLFDLWDSAAVTVSQMLIAVPAALTIGIGIGVWLYYCPRVRPAMLLLVDQAQTIPIFSYLVPIVVFFGLGPAPAIVASIIYAAPATVRAAVLGLEQAAADVGELATSTGATRRQTLFSFLLPTARTALQTGGTQVVLLAFSTAILASLVGSGGLGYDVLVTMRQLNIGRGIEAGLAITLLAIAMNGYVKAGFMGGGQRPRLPTGPHLPIGRHLLAVALVALIGTTLLSLAIPALGAYPESWTVSTGRVTDVFVNWFTVTFFAPLDAIKSLLVLNVFLPFEKLLLSLPWFPVALTLAVAGYLTGGLVRGLTIGLLVAFLAMVGLWEKAMSTVYLCTLGVLMAVGVGMPLGILSARSRAIAFVVLPVANTLQTLPPFLYLVPAIMLFGTGDFSAFFAIFLFAVVPMVRYADAGMRSVPENLNEAGRQMGCTSLQRFWNVEFPVATPLLLVGVNQTILLGLSMLVVTALIGTHDLGQEALYALQKSRPGQAIVAGLAVAAIAVVSDRLIGGLAEARLEAKRARKQPRSEPATTAENAAE